MFVINFNEKPRRGLPDTVLFSDNIDRLRSGFVAGSAGRTNRALRRNRNGAASNRYGEA